LWALAGAVYVVPHAAASIKVERRNRVKDAIVLSVHEAADDRAIREIAKREGSDVRVVVYAPNEHYRDGPSSRGIRLDRYFAGLPVLIRGAPRTRATGVVISDP